jgi:hypothetical protein
MFVEERKSLVPAGIRTPDRPAPNYSLFRLRHIGSYEILTASLNKNTNKEISTSSSALLLSHFTQKTSTATYNVLRAALLKIQVFWNRTLCRWVSGSRS